MRQNTHSDDCESTPDAIYLARQGLHNLSNPKHLDLLQLKGRAADGFLTIGREELGVAAGEPELSSLMSSFSSLPGLKYGTRFAGILTGSPVFGFRPRAPRSRTRKLPKPRSSIFSRLIQCFNDAFKDNFD